MTASPRHPGRRIGIRLQLSSVFAAVAVLVAAVVLGVAYYQAERYLTEFATRQMDLAGLALANHTRSHFEPVALAVDVVASSGIFEVSLDERGEQFFPAAELLLDKYPGISLIFVGFNDGSYLRTGITTPLVSARAGIPDGENPGRLRGFLHPRPSSEADAQLAEWFYLDEDGDWQGTPGSTIDYNPREEPWYSAAADTDDVHWTEVTVWGNGKTGIIAAKARRDDDGGLEGVVGVGVEFDQLGQFFDSVSISDNSLAFIARADGEILAHPDFNEVAELTEGGGVGSWDAFNLSDAVYGRAHPLERELFTRLPTDGGSEVFDYNGRGYVGSARPVTGRIGIDAAVYAGVPLADFVGFAVRAHLKAFAVALALVLITVLLSMRLAASMARPIEQLASMATSVERHGLEGVAEHPGSVIREVDDAGSAFNAMIGGLRERELIRNLFGRYVPADVATEIIRGKGALEPVEAECSILFVDLAGFTSLAEGLRPIELVEVLNQFFGLATGIIEQHDGVVTQYQGDAILAIFNVPIPRPDHATSAVMAAIGLVHASEDNTFAERQLSIRVGVNTGNVVAGNVGASDRLHYTVHGDAVNVAARLEQLNKRFGTQVLVSEATRDACPDIEFEPIGELEVRGKREPVIVYTLRESDGPRYVRMDDKG